MTNAVAMTELHTDRLGLRLFGADDARAFVALAGDLAVARMTSDIPHPLTEAEAAPWLRQEPGEVRFALEYQGQLVGGAGYFRRPSGAGELGFWIGRPWWGLGFATEATRAIVGYGFTDGGLQSFSSSHFVDNSSSERVLQKLGFQPIGRASMWCVARRSMVDVVEYWLARPAEQRLPAERRWRSLLDKVRWPAQAARQKLTQGRAGGS